VNYYTLTHEYQVILCDYPLGVVKSFRGFEHGYRSLLRLKFHQGLAKGFLGDSGWGS
jgi:hypothetical protein